MKLMPGTSRKIWIAPANKKATLRWLFLIYLAFHLIFESHGFKLWVKSYFSGLRRVISNPRQAIMKVMNSSANFPRLGTGLGVLTTGAVQETFNTFDVVVLLDDTKDASIASLPTPPVPW